MLHVPVKCACRILHVCVYTHTLLVVYTTCVKCTCKFESERKLQEVLLFLFIFVFEGVLYFILHMTTTFDSKLDLTYQGTIKIFMGFSLYFFIWKESLLETFLCYIRGYSYR